MADVFKAGDVVRLKTGEGPTLCVWSVEIPADGAGSCCWFDRGNDGWTLKRADFLGSSLVRAVSTEERFAAELADLRATLQGDA